jgi:hypothetical protein
LGPIEALTFFCSFYFLLDEQKILYKDQIVIKSGDNPANLPVPARWSKDEAGRQLKGVANVGIKF